MKHTHRPRFAESWLAGAALAAGLALSAPPLVAQSSSAPADENEPVKLDKFVVTGSLIPIAADTPAVPIVVLTAADIANTGVTRDIGDVLKKINPAFFGRGNWGADNGNTAANSTNGATTVALRNRATLVLINGRRAAVAPVAATGAGSFVDVGMIPVAAIDRVEILNDGASATYGTDAVSGVVNIILKTNYRGVEVGGSFNWAPNASNWSSRHAYVVAGGGTEKTDVTLSAEWRRTDPLFQYERPWGRGQFRTPSFAGVFTPDSGTTFYYLNPNRNAPPTNLDLSIADLVAQGIYQGPYTQDQIQQFFDLSEKATLNLKTNRRSVTAAIDHRWTDRLTAFADILVTHSITESMLNAQPVTGNVAANHPANPANVTVQARNRFVDFPRIRLGDSLGVRGVFGLKGTVGSWNWEAAAALNRTTQGVRQINLIDANAYNAAVTDGTYNPFARRQAPGVIERIVGTGYQDYITRVNSFDLRLNGELFQLPAGPLQVGLGIETRTERVSMVDDRNDRLALWLGGTAQNPFSAKMGIDGYSLELRVPVFSENQNIPGVRSLELGLAARKEFYNSTTDPLVPKYSLRWMPFNDEFVLRATYGESFTAPDLFSLFGPANSGFTPGVTLARFDAAGQPLNVFTNSRQYNSRGGSNPNLVPSESRNWTAGFVWSPRAIKGFSLSVDWFDIDERDLIGLVPAFTLLQSVEQFGPASPYAHQVRLGTAVGGELLFDSGAPVTAPGQITSGASNSVWITNPRLNVAGIWQSGADLRADYSWTTERWGKFNLSGVATYIHEYVQKTLPTSDPADLSDGFSGTSTYPRYRTYTSLDWTFRAFTAGISQTFIPELDDLNAPVLAKIDSYQTFDVRFSYKFSSWQNPWLRGLRLSAGVNNLLNEDPPYSSEGNQNRDINTYDTFGRVFYVSANYKF
jgi:iron complex outermembrane receptor protein